MTTTTTARNLVAKWLMCDDAVKGEHIWKTLRRMKPTPDVMRPWADAGYFHFTWAIVSWPLADLIRYCDLEAPEGASVEVQSRYRNGRECARRQLAGQIGNANIHIDGVSGPLPGATREERASWLRGDIMTPLDPSAYAEAPVRSTAAADYACGT